MKTHKRLPQLSVLLGLYALSAAALAACDGGTTASVQEVPYIVGSTESPINGSYSLDAHQAAPLPEYKPTSSGEGCDMCDAMLGVDNCGNPCGSNHQNDPTEYGCDMPGQCACSSEGGFLVGRCNSRQPLVCTYCPTGTELADPCGTRCKVVDRDNEDLPPPDGTTCPDDYPVSCGNGYCCPNDHAICCADSAYCGTSRFACGAVDWKSEGDSGGSGACVNDGAGVTSGCNQLGYREGIDCFGGGPPKNSCRAMANSDFASVGGMSGCNNEYGNMTCYCCN